MKIFLSTIILVSSLSAFELIHVSNSVDEKSLSELSQRYKKEIVISDNRAYLVPSDCLLERHFGGLSQNKVEIVGEEFQNGYLAVTEGVFEAKNTADIKKEIEKQKISDSIEAKVAKAFLDDVDGHLFGGLSQGSIDLVAQKKIVKEIVQEQKQHNRKEEAIESRKNPACRVVDDGSGYMLLDIKDPKLYKDSKLEQIINNFILFN